MISRRMPRIEDQLISPEFRRVHYTNIDRNYPHVRSTEQLMHARGFLTSFDYYAKTREGLLYVYSPNVVPQVIGRRMIDRALRGARLF